MSASEKQTQAAAPPSTLVGEKMAAESDKKLRHELSALDLLGLSLGGIIGSGWLFAVNGAAAIAGPAVVLSWLIGGILVLFIGLNYAELSGMIPRSGAIVRYPHYTHGSYTGFIMGWAYLLSAFTVPTIEAEAVVGYAATYIPSLSSSTTILGSTISVLSGEGIGLALVLMVIFFLLNYFGIKALGKTNTPVTLWKLLIPTLTFLLLFATFNASNFSAYGGFFPLGVSPMFIAIPTGGIIFSYLGFRQALEFGGEAKNPQRDVPRATIFSLLIAIVLYTLLQVTYIGAIKWPVSGIPAGDWVKLTSSASLYSSGPFYEALTKSGIAALGAFGVVLLIDAYISPSGTGWIYMGTSTRTFYGLAADGYLPEAFLKVNEKTRIPLWSLIASLILGLVFLAPFPSWYLLVGFISSATVFTYMMGGVGLRVLRRTAGELHRPFRLSASSIIAPIGFLAASLIVYWSTFSVLYFVFVAILAGLPLYYIFYAPKGLGVSRGAAAGLGVVFWIALIALAYYGYNSILVYNANNAASPPPNFDSVLMSSFGVFFGGIAVLSIVFTAAFQFLSKPEHRRQVASGWWLVVYSLVILSLSFIGGFGPLLTPVIPFPYDELLMVVLGVVFYAVAVYSGYRTEDIDHIIALQTGVQEKT
jgi:amino acid transporter